MSSSGLGAPRFLVVGCGGIGGIVASHLLATGHDVTVLCRNAAVREALLSRGFEVHGATSLFRVAASSVVAELPSGCEPFDYVLLCTQPPEVEAAVGSVQAALAEHSRVVCLQNGLCEPRVAKLVGEERVLGTVVMWGASVLGPGVYDRTSTGGFVLGTLRGEPDARMAGLAAALASIGPVVQTSNLLGARWSKLAINCAISTLGTIAGAHLGSLMLSAPARRLALEIISEVVQVAQAEGVSLEKVPGIIDVRHLSLPNRAALAFPARALKHALLLGIGLRYRRLRSSMLTAIEHAKPPAVGFLNGEIVERAERHGLAAPVNREAVATVLAIARGDSTASFTTLRALYEKTHSGTEGRQHAAGRSET